MWTFITQTLTSALLANWNHLNNRTVKARGVCVCTSTRAHLCRTLCDPIDCSPPGSSVHGTSQARIQEWVAISSSRGSSWPRDWTLVSCIGQQVLFHLCHLGGTWGVRFIDEVQSNTSGSLLPEDYRIFVLKGIWESQIAQSLTNTPHYNVHFCALWPFSGGGV